MSDNGVIVDNPLALAGLYHLGVFLPPERRKLKYPYTGAGLKRILHIINDSASEIQAESMITIRKIMAAVKIEGVLVQTDDYSLISLAEAGLPDIQNDIIPDFKPDYLVVWSDSPLSPAVRYYQPEEVSGVQVLLCHAVASVTSDSERKAECWKAVKELFGM